MQFSERRPSSNLKVWLLPLLSIVFVLVLSQIISPMLTTHDGGLSFSEDSSSRSESAPNFVFLLVDDLGWSGIGQDEYDLASVTPFLSKLGQDGIIMSNYYSQELCTPARASLLTGRYPISMGMQYWELEVDENWGLNISETLLSEVMTDNGYTSYMLGKWNLGHFSPRYLPTARGFSGFLGYLGARTYYWSKKVPNYDNFRDQIYSNSDCYAPYNGTDLHKYSTFLYADKAVQIVEDHNYTSSPLFLYVAFQGVHDPYLDVDYFQSGIPTSYLSDSLRGDYHHRHCCCCYC